MTLNEFRAWFDGFSEGIDKVPTEKQWAKIKSKMKEIDDTPITYPIFVDRYVQPYRRWINDYWSNGMLTGAPTHIVDDNSLVKFDSGSAMYAAGKAEFQSLAA